MKGNKKVFIVTEAILAVLVILTAIGMLRGKNDEERGKISVIIQGSDDSRWAAFKYGLRMAAQDEEMELFIVSMGERFTVEEEEEAIENEIANGADAVIVQPAPGDAAQKMLKKLRRKIPVILTEESMSGEGKSGGFPVVKPDHYAVGQALAEELLKDNNGTVEGKTMGFVAKCGNSEAVQERKEGIDSVLKEMGVKKVWEISDPSKEEEDTVLERKSKVDFVIALDDYSLVLAGKAVAANNLHGALVYGIGNSMEAVYCLDTDYVQCLVVPDDFDMGYQSLVKASESFGYIFRKPKSQTIGFTVMRKQNLFSKENQEILFTMSQ
ncbi:MAG: substrate-binding domain-containing protein [Hespellia sp.]|jgi:ribose transport system substrate-binding protein|nr:substrate-binding domain-containing protein [Hespellia sp.]